MSQPWFWAHDQSQGLQRVWAKRGSMGVTFHVPKSAKECEVIPSHSQIAPTLGVGVPMDFLIFKGQLQGSKPNGLKRFLCH
jgi:hypothetical protein